MGEFMLTLGQSLFNLLVFITFSITGLYLLSRYKKVVDFLIAKKTGIKGQIVVIIVAGILIILASQYAIVVAGARVNVRDCIAIFAGMLAGPLAGISVGLIGGIYRMSLGGWTAIPCGLATIVAGFIGAWLYEPKRRKIMIPVVAIGIGFIGGIYRYSLGMEWSGALICILFVMFAGFLCVKGAKEGYRIKNLTTRQIGVVALITGIWECIHIDIFGPFLGEKAAAEAFSILTTHFLLPMTAINILGIVTFLLVCREATIVREQSIKLKQSHGELEQKVAERTKELAIANEKLKERYNELKGAEAMLQRDISERKKIEEEREALVKGLEETNLKLAEKAKELEESRRATLNIAEDIEKAKRGAEKAKGELEATAPGIA
jgi:LytS/YehU family sensor histidine kinase